MTKLQIIKHLEENYGKSWIYGGKLAREVRELTGTKESVVERRCRELVNENVLEKQLIQIDGVGPKVVMYRVVDVKEECNHPAGSVIDGKAICDTCGYINENPSQMFHTDFSEQTEKLNL